MEKLFGSLSIYIMTNTLTSWQHRETWRFKFPPLLVKQYYIEQEAEPDYTVQPWGQVNHSLVGSAITIS